MRAVSGTVLPAPVFLDRLFIGRRRAISVSARYRSRRYSLGEPGHGPGLRGIISLRSHLSFRLSVRESDCRRETSRLETSRFPQIGRPRSLLINFARFNLFLPFYPRCRYRSTFETCREDSRMKLRAISYVRTKAHAGASRVKSTQRQSRFYIIIVIRNESIVVQTTLEITIKWTLHARLLHKYYYINRPEVKAIRAVLMNSQTRINFHLRLYSSLQLRFNLRERIPGPGNSPPVQSLRHAVGGGRVVRDQEH